jgi:hypothetical protein
MSTDGAAEYISSLRAACDMEKRESALRSSEIVSASHEHLRSLGIDPVSGMSYAEILNAKTNILAARIGKAIDSLGLVIERVPQIALLPTEDFNAWATVAPNGDRICVLDPELSGSLLYFSWSLAEATTQAPESNVQRDYLKCCFMTIASCEMLAYGGYEPARQYLRSVGLTGDQSWFMFGVFLARAIESFILSHEFAHHIAGHLDRLEKCVLRRSHPLQKTINIYNRSQTQEFVADRLGADIFMATQSDMYSPHFLCAPLVFLDYLTFSETFVLAYPSSSTHPPASERKQRLQSYLSNLLPTEATEYYNVTGPFWRLVEEVKQSATVRGTA